MRVILGNPKTGLIAIFLTSASSFLIAWVGGYDASGEAPRTLMTGFLSVLSALLFVPIVLAQRYASLAGRWRTANSVACVDACLAVAFQAGLSAYALVRPDGGWDPLVAPGAVSGLVVLATAIVRPGEEHRRIQDGMIAAGAVFAVALAGLLVMTPLDDPADAIAPAARVVVLVLASAVSALIAYDFGSRLRSAGTEPRP